MTDKWNKKICVEHITTITSPFDKLNQNGKKLPNFAEMIRNIGRRKPK